MTENKIQVEFFAKLIGGRSAVIIFLINGVKLQGVIEDFDSSGVVLEHKGHKQFVFCHAISTIMPTMNNQTFNN
jgi:host factor-I protein